MLEIMKIKDDYDSCVAGHFGDVGTAEFLYTYEVPITAAPNQ